MSPKDNHPKAVLGRLINCPLTTARARSVSRLHVVHTAEPARLTSPHTAKMSRYRDRILGGIATAVSAAASLPPIAAPAASGCAQRTSGV
jgi:hypothetical protein